MAASTWLVPYVLTKAVPNWLKEKTGRELSVVDASFNPFTLRLNASSIAFREKGAGNALATVAALELKGSWATLVNFAWTADHITLTKPEINARIAADGSLDWVRFLDALPKSTEPPSDSMPRIVLHNVSIADAAIRLTDERAGASENRFNLAPLTFKLDKLSTLPRDRGDYALQATLNDQTRVQWKGRVGLNPIESSGDLAITNLPLARALSMANVKLPVTLDGTASLIANYRAAAGTDFVAVGVGEGALNVTDLRAQQGKDEASVKSIRVSPVSMSWAHQGAKGQQQRVFAVQPLKATVDGVSAKAGDSKEALLNIAQIAMTQPLSVDVAGQRIDVPQVTISGLQATLERDRSGTLLLPFNAKQAVQATTAPAALNAAAATPVPVNALANANAWRINVAEIVTERAALALSDQSFAAPQAATATLDATLSVTVTTGDASSVRVGGKRFAVNTIALRDEAATSPWFTVKEVRAAPFDLDALGPKVELPKFDVTGPLVKLSLDRGGVDLAIKLAPAVAAAAGPASTPTPATVAANSGKSTPTKISIGGIALNGGRVALTDNTLAAPATHAAENIRITVDRVELDGSKPITAVVNAALASGGALQAKLKFDQRRNEGEAAVSAERVALTAASPYLNRNTRLKLTKGELATSGLVRFTAAANAPESFSFAGKVKVSDLELVDETTQAPFSQWAELSTTDLTVRQAANGLDIALVDLLLDQPRGKLTISESGVVNLTQIGKPGAMAATASGTPAQTATAPSPATAAGDNVAAGKRDLRVRADRVQVTGGDIEFADLSLRPQFGVRISDLSGLIVGLSTEPSSRAEVSMEGKVDEFGLARLSGNLSPLGATEYTDLKATFRNLEMKNLTPYSGKFAGRKIESGKLSLDLEYKINQRKLKGENQVIIDNLTLGERVESKDATNLPLDLAIALLSDSKGVIDLGLPVQGSLNDPQFSYGSLIWKAIVNVLTKIVTAPFRALGALLGGSGEEFEAIIFEPGEARLLPPEREKLAKLARALEQRPQLKLTIEGRFDKALDREALADNIVKLDVSKRAGMKPPGANEPLIISFTDARVQAALDELAAAVGADAAKLRAQYLPPAGNAVTGLLQNAREKLTEKGRTEAAEARAKYYPELFKLLHAKQQVPDIAYATLAGFRAEAAKNTLTAVNKFDAGRVSVAAPQAVTESKPSQVATTLALSVK